MRHDLFGAGARGFLREPFQSRAGQCLHFYLSLPRRLLCAYICWATSSQLTLSLGIIGSLMNYSCLTTIRKEIPSNCHCKSGVASSSLMANFMRKIEYKSYWNLDILSLSAGPSYWESFWNESVQSLPSDSARFRLSPESKFRLCAELL